MLDKGKNLFTSSTAAASAGMTSGRELKGRGRGWEMVLDDNAERAYLFEHVWRQVQKKFSTPDLHGVDWDTLKVEYQRPALHQQQP